MNYIFPFNKIEKDSKIVLYGAGLVGQEFYAQISATEYCHVVSWIDREFEFYQKRGLDVESPQSIAEKDYDLIIIAISKKDIADEIKGELSRSFDENKLFWDDYVNAEPKLGIIRKDVNITVTTECFPEEFVTADNLDMAIRYLLCRDIVNKVEDVNHLNLYMRYWMIIANFREKGIGDKLEKIGPDKFLANFKELIESMRRDGFYQSEPVLIDEHNRIINGRHRCASALVLEKKIWASFQRGIGANIRDYKWFYDNGFSVIDMQRILYGFSEIYKKCNLILLFGTIKQSWEMVQKQFEKRLKVVGYVDLDFRNDYLGFENIIHDIYNDASWDDPWKDRKLKLLKFAPLVVRVLIVSDEDRNINNIYEETNEIKKDLRNLFALEMGNRKDNISMHAADSIEEFIRLKKYFSFSEQS